MLVSVRQLQKETNHEAPDSIKSEKPIKHKVAVTRSATVKAEPVNKDLIKGSITGKDANLRNRKEMISAKGFEPAEFAYERAIGKNDPLYSNFAELIALTKRKVGRIVLKEDTKLIGYATGFMVSEKLMLTNWHVFRDAGMAADSEAYFFYEYDANGHPQRPAIFKFDATVFYNNEELDFCLVAVQPMDVTNKIPLKSIGYLYLDKGLGKIGDVNTEKLNIIHHPQGDYKQISIRENTFVGIDDTKIFYETDTAQGSSGSPVFNDQWQVVGLHHKSIAKMTPDGKDYLDKDDKVIPITDDKIDVTRVVWLKNEGMRISVILNYLSTKYPADSHIAALATVPPTENLSYGATIAGTDAQPVTNSTPVAETGNTINISIPVSALRTEPFIDIRISSGQTDNLGSPAVIASAGDRTTELLFELAKADKEKNVDFSKCTGYDPGFLNVNIPLPQPQKLLQKQMALLADKTSELKYFKYSVLFNAVTHMPALCAINVEGDANMRKDDSKRSDDWLRDSRIDVECQLYDKFYAASNFDKGHMSRFEDANWDTSETDALRNGIYTCFYTNACPQVAALNRSGGLWGKLEKAILEQGIKKENKNQAKMTVFNGPIFNAEKDRIFKGVTIPMDFFKIILWHDDNGNLKATAFKLSQEMLVSQIKFDESMRLDTLEALDADKLVAFKEYQVSIKSLSRLTKINFKKLEKYDTFKAKAGVEELHISNKEAMML